MSRFMVQEGEFASPGEELPLITVRRLLRHLGVHNASRAEQEQAVATWVEANELQDDLRVALAAQEFPTP